MAENKNSNNNQPRDNKDSYSQESYRQINESYNDRGNYVRENTPPPTRVRRGGGQPSDK